MQPSLPAKADVNCILKFKPRFSSDLYNASIDVVGKHLSGLLLFKQMPDSSMRVVFTNEAGIKFFDFGFGKKNEFTVHSVIKQFKKKPVIKTLKNDFELVMMQKIGLEKPMVISSGNQLKFGFPNKKDWNYMVTDGSCNNLIQMETSSESGIKTTAKLMGKLTPPDSIFIQHFNFNMQIKLKKISR